MLRYNDVSFSYASAAGPVHALRNVTLDLNPGEILAVLGSNGSGKSTLARLSNGIELPASGSVTVDGTATDDPHRLYDVRSNVGIVFQHPDDQLVATSVEDDVAFGPENLGLERSEIRRRVDDAIAATGLQGLERREPHLLSGGQKQRLAIAGALAMRPRYMVLDEPTSMLDPVGRDEVLSVVAALRNAGHGIMLITHDLSEAAMADRAVVLSSGAAVFSGTLSELLGESRLREWAVELPQVTELVARLIALGVPIPPSVVVPEEIVEALCP